MKHFLVPTDFSECSAEAYPFLFEQAELLGKEGLHVTLLNVVTIPIITSPDALVFVPPDTENWTKEATKVAGKELTAIREKVFHDLNVTTSVISGAEAVHQQIVNVAKEHNVDLIVMGTHGRSGINRLLLGSVADRVIRIAPCPILLVPPKSQQTGD